MKLDVLQCKRHEVDVAETDVATGCPFSTSDHRARRSVHISYVAACSESENAERESRLCVDISRHVVG